MTEFLNGYLTSSSFSPDQQDQSSCSAPTGRHASRTNRNTRGRALDYVVLSITLCNFSLTYPHESKISLSSQSIKHILSFRSGFSFSFFPFFFLLTFLKYIFLSKCLLDPRTGYYLNNWYFCPPPFFQNDIFFQKYSEKGGGGTSPSSWD